MEKRDFLAKAMVEHRLPIDIGTLPIRLTKRRLQNPNPVLECPMLILQLPITRQALFCSASDSNDCPPHQEHTSPEISRGNIAIAFGSP
jgi:hypothetical protein